MSTYKKRLTDLLSTIFGNMERLKHSLVCPLLFQASQAWSVAASPPLARPAGPWPPIGPAGGRRTAAPRGLQAGGRLEDDRRTAGGRGLQAWATDGAVGGGRPPQEEHLSLRT